jgi:hypothetical protein
MKVDISSDDQCCKAPADVAKLDHISTATTAADGLRRATKAVLKGCNPYINGELRTESKGLQAKPQ